MKRESGKIEQIKSGAVAAICKYGVAGASVSKIAAMAGVSDGYLYRHYDSKEELMDVIFDNILNNITDKIEYLLENCSNVKEIAEGFMDYLYEKSLENSDMIKFLIIFQNDFSLEMNSRVVDRITALCGDIVELGRVKEELREEVTPLELYLSLVSLPLQFLSLQYKKLFSDSDVEFQRIKDIAFNSLFKI